MFYKHRVLEALLDFNINIHFPLKPSVVNKLFVQNHYYYNYCCSSQSKLHPTIKFTKRKINLQNIQKL